MRKLHLRDPDRAEEWIVKRGPRRGQTFRSSWCGRIGTAEEFDLVEDVLDATCLLCLSKLERDADPDLIPSYLRNRSYARALCVLRDRHRDEFDELVEELLPDVIAEDADR